PNLTLAPRLALGLDVEIDSQVLVRHFGGPHATADGWLDKPWQMQLHSVEGIEEDPNPKSMGVTLTLKSREPALILGADDMWTAKGSTSSIADGVLRVSKGVSRTFTRASPAWVDDP